MHEQAADELLWWLSFQNWRPMQPEVEEMVYVRLSFAWSVLMQALADGVPAPVTLEQRVSAIHATVFDLWVERGLEFLEAYGKAGPKDDLGHSLN